MLDIVTVKDLYEECKRNDEENLKKGIVSDYVNYKIYIEQDGELVPFQGISRIDAGKILILK